ncbi:pectin acetylesterase-family hydrolase [soil metagenome]
MLKLLSIFLLLLLSSGAARAQNTSGVPDEPEIRVAAASDGWRMIAGGERTGCAFGTPYSFFHRPGADATRLLIYFQGGGACWSWVSCSGMFDTSVERTELSELRGVFDYSNPANPFRDYGTLFIPYCTGDVHVGAAEVSYGENAGSRPLAHHGARNVDAALRWAKPQLAEPRQIVVAGASAGSYGAIFHAPRIAALYPSADLVTIGDSGVPLLHDYPTILERWGAGAVLRSIWKADADAPLTLEQAYREAAATPRMRAVVQITSDRDAVQSAFYLISSSPGWREDSHALLDGLERDGANIHSFVVAGTDHGLLRTDAFYEYEANEMPLVEWIRALIAGERVESVRCPDCSVP